MISLSYFLIAWFALLGLYLIMSLISVIQMVRFAMSGPWTYAFTACFLVLVTVTVLGSCLYFLTVDWTQGVNLLGGLTSSSYFNP